MTEPPEKLVQIPRAVRILLGLFALLASVIFLIVGTSLVVADRSQMPSPQGALVLGLFLAALGLGFGFIGVRLVKMKGATDYLFTVRGALIGGPVICVMGLIIGISAIFHGEIRAVVPGAVLVSIGMGIYHSGRRRQSALENPPAAQEAADHPAPMPQPASAPIATADVDRAAGESGGRIRALVWQAAIALAIIAAVAAISVRRAASDSEWMTSRQYQREFDTRGPQGYYPLAVDGECRRDGEMFRPHWDVIPPGASFFAHHGMTREDYERRDRDYRSRGYTRGTLTRFKDCSGIERYQATWLKR